jgi:hypothetical protein
MNKFLALYTIMHRVSGRTALKSVYFQTSNHTLQWRDVINNSAIKIYSVGKKFLIYEK